MYLELSTQQADSELDQLIHTQGFELALDLLIRYGGGGGC